MSPKIIIHRKNKKEKTTNYSIYWIIIVIVILTAVTYVITMVHLSSPNDKSSTKLQAAERKSTKIPVFAPKLLPTTKPIEKRSIINEKINRRCPNRIIPIREEYKTPINKKKGDIDLHFIHIPKCGGTSMTAILRELACYLDSERNIDCCTNPGFCDWHAFRRCEAIKGCINHFPQRSVFMRMIYAFNSFHFNRPWIFKKPPSIAMFREPISR